MKLVPLTQGEFAMVDDDDFELVSRHSWQVKRVRNSSRKYAMTTIMKGGKKTTMSMHRLICDHYAAIFDHSDGNGLNNQKINLRVASNVENGRNRNLQVHSSRFKGVSRHSDGKGWVAHIRVNKKLLSLCYVKKEEDAARAYDSAALLHFGAFAKTNQQMGLL